VHKRDSVFIFANLFNWIPYLRNLVIQRRHRRAHQACPSCSRMNPPQARFCMTCGTRVDSRPGS
jgi:rRNA maturation endonuclease Nob1